MDIKSKYLVDINDYVKIQKINAGSFGTVFSVQDKKTKEFLAAKITNINSKEDKKFVNREIKAMTYFNHPTIIKFKGYSLEDFSGKKNVTIFMELAENGSLRDVLKNSLKGLAPEKYDNTAKQKILIGIARGMMMLHKNHLIHRDLKPENILLDKNFQPLITDFGLSKFYETGKSMNQSGVRGSYIYMAPEVLINNNYNIKADVYSFGILMYEVITGQDPYPDVTNKKISLYKLPSFVNEKNLRPKFNFPIKKSLRKLIESCWSQNPNERPTFEQIFNKLAYNFDDFISDDEDENKDDENKEDENEYETEDEEFDNKYYLSYVDKLAIDDYLEEIVNNDYDYKSSNSNTDNLNGKLKLIENKISIIEKSHDQLKEEKEAILDQNNEMMKKLASVEKKLNEKMAEIDELRTEVEKNQINIKALQKENKKSNSFFLSAQEKNDEFKNDIQSIKIEIKKLKNDQIISDDLLDRISDVEQNLHESKKNVNLLRGEKEEINNNIKCLKYEVKKLKNDQIISDDLLDRLSDVEQNLHESKENINLLRGEKEEINNNIKCLKYEVKKLKAS